MRRIYSLLLVALSVHLCHSSTLEISHSCDGINWESRGIVTVKNEKSVSGNFSQAPISSQLLSCLWSKAQTDEFYYVRAPDSFSDQLSPSRYVQSFSKCRHLFCSDLADSLTVYTDSKGGVLSLFSEGRRDCVPGEDWSRGSRSLHRERLSTSLHLVHAHQHPGPEPPVEQFLRQHRDDGDKKKDTGEEKSFFQKYWHYFLIGFIVYTLMGAFVKPAGGEEGGGGGGGE